MKKLITFLGIISLIGMQSCGIADRVNPNDGGNFSAKIDGQNWKADEVTAITLFGSFSMTATKGDDIFTVAFLFSEIEEGKTYEFNGIENTNAFTSITYATKDKSYIYQDGSITIDKFTDNRRVEGRLELNMVSSDGEVISVTDGAFKAEIFI